MYVCDDCFDKNPALLRGAMTCTGTCEWCGHFHSDWSSHKHVQWVKNVRRPIGAGNPKKYILDQLKESAPATPVPEAIVRAGVRISRDTAIRMRNFMDGFRKAHAGSDDPYKKGFHDALDFMIHQIDQDLERNRT